MRIFFIRIYLWLINWCPWHLRSEIRTMGDIIRRKDLELAGQPDEPTARAMLCQLRVHQESVRQRTGYMVSAFIPSGAVEKLIPLGPEKQKQFASVVAEVLVQNAIHGILKRSQATNKLTALIFDPLTQRGGNVQLAGGVFETDQGPEIVSMRPNVPEFKQLRDSK